MHLATAQGKGVILQIIGGVMRRVMMLWGVYIIKNGETTTIPMSYLKIHIKFMSIII